jgi:hypothetical protein
MYPVGISLTVSEFTVMQLGKNTHNESAINNLILFLFLKFNSSESVRQP